MRMINDEELRHQPWLPVGAKFTSAYPQGPDGGCCIAEDFWVVPTRDIASATRSPCRQGL